MGRFKTDTQNSEIGDILVRDYGYIPLGLEQYQRKYSLNNDKYAVVTFHFQDRKLMTFDVMIYLKTDNVSSDKAIEYMNFKIDEEWLKYKDVFINNVDELLEPFIGE